MSYNKPVVHPTDKEPLTMRIRCYACLALSLSLAMGLVPDAMAQTPKVLMFSKSSAYQHDVVARRGSELSLAESIVIDLGKRHGFEVTATKDGAQITAANLKNYQAVFFFTQGNLCVPGVDKQPPMRQEDRQAILDFVKDGGGFVGTHCGGADTFHEWAENGKKPFLEMVGGEFIGHGPQQVSFIEIVDPKFPAIASWPRTFTLHDEWYAYQGFTPDIHVVMMLRTSGMVGGKLYDRDPYPITWLKQYGKGRLFYTGLGHRDAVWKEPLYQEMVAKAVLWSLGKIDADAAPNLKDLFGDEKAALTRINPPSRK